jgi:hypothetical protein
VSIPVTAPWNKRPYRIGGDGLTACEGHVNGMTIAQRQCPRCGHLIDQPRLAEDDRDAVIASLRQEIRLLQETIAYLRGSLGSRVRPGR